MAADNFSTIAGQWATRRTLALPNADTTRRVISPEWARRATVTFVAAEGSTADTGKVASTGTDGAAIGTDAYPIVSGGSFTFRLAAGRGRVEGGASLYVTGGTNAGYCHVFYEGE